MASDRTSERFKELERLALAGGLEPFDVLFFEVPSRVIWEVASYGLPTRYRHWSFGKSYQYQKTQGEMGYSKIYELILNNDPSYAFLDDSNTDTVNLLIAAHCFAHSDFFANNAMFKEMGETSMIQVAKRHAEIIDQYRNDYGDDEVDDWLDIALSLERHVDVYRGVRRKRYPERHIEYKERNVSPWEDLVKHNKKPLVEKLVKGLHIPPHPERDILWFLSEYANLEPWQKKIFEIVRRESYYFYPQFRTKIMNEGWASYWHSYLMTQYALGNNNELGVTDLKHPLTNEEHLDFAAAHEKVVQPGAKIPLKIEVPEEVNGRRTGRAKKIWNPVFNQNPRAFSAAIRVNPYYVGFKMFHDIKKRWDEYYEQGYMENEWGEKIPVTINGSQKILEVREQEDDVSFFRKYLTPELAEELHLFRMSNNDLYDDNYGVQREIINRGSSNNAGDEFGSMPVDEQVVENQTVIVNSKEIKGIINGLTSDLANYGVPYIVVRRVDEAGLIRLEHMEDKANVEIKYAEQVLRYIHKAWGRPVELIRKEKDRTWILSFDGISFEVDHEASDYPESVEQSDVPSSW